MTKQFITEVDRQAGEKLRYYRNMRALTQQKLARRLNITPQQLQKYEKATNRMTIGILYKAAQALNVPIVEFFDSQTMPKSNRKSDEIVRNFHQLSPQRQQIMLDISRSLMKEQNQNPV